jgi:predicted HicB family RNase H-like nuclease
VEQQTKKRKVGRPRFPRGTAKSRIVPVRFNSEDLKSITAAAKANKQTLSEWIRSTLNAAVAK